MIPSRRPALYGLLRQGSLALALLPWLGGSAQALVLKLTELCTPFGYQLSPLQERTVSTRHQLEVIVRAPPGEPPRLAELRTADGTILQSNWELQAPLIEELTATNPTNGYYVRTGPPLPAGETVLVGSLRPRYCWANASGINGELSDFSCAPGAPIDCCATGTFASVDAPLALPAEAWITEAVFHVESNAEETPSVDETLTLMAAAAPITATQPVPSLVRLRCLSVAGASSPEFHLDAQFPVVPAGAIPDDVVRIELAVFLPADTSEPAVLEDAAESTDAGAAVTPSQAVARVSWRSLPCLGQASRVFAMTQEPPRAWNILNQQLASLPSGLLDYEVAVFTEEGLRESARVSLAVPLDCQAADAAQLSWQRGHFADGCANTELGFDMNARYPEVSSLQSNNGLCEDLEPGAFGEAATAVEVLPNAQSFDGLEGPPAFTVDPSTTATQPVAPPQATATEPVAGPETDQLPGNQPQPPSATPPQAHAGCHLGQTHSNSAPLFGFGTLMALYWLRKRG